MEPKQFKDVVRHVLEENGVGNADAVTRDIVSALKLAERILGTPPSPPPSPSTSTIIVPASSTEGIQRATDLPKPATITEAPPVAGAAAEEDAAQTEYWSTESLRAHLASILPNSIEIEVPGMEGKIVIGRNISSPLANMPLVSVSYGIQGQDQGPRVNVMTTQQSVTAKDITDDIIRQAGYMYSKEKRVVRAPINPPPAPSLAEIERMASRVRIDGDNVSADDRRGAAEDAALMAANRPAQWR